MKKIKISQQISTDNSDALCKYLRDIYKLEMITVENEVLLCEKIKNNDTKALEKLILANLRFVISVAKQYQNQGLSLTDLISEGNIGLIKAASRFDSTKGFKFISYAVWWIRQSILQAISENSRVIRLPQNKILISNRIQKTYNYLYQQFEREPTIEEISNTLGIDPLIVKLIMEKNDKATSLDTPISKDDENFSLVDIIANTDYDDDNSQKDDLIDVLQTLSQRDAKIIKMYFGIGYAHRYTLDEIAKELDITKENVRQIKNKIIVKLRKKFN